MFNLHGILSIFVVDQLGDINCINQKHETYNQLYGRKQMELTYTCIYIYD